MTPLERRYRRLLWLLPVDERRARGEELVGVLVDLDAGRSWPSRGEAWAVGLLALRLWGARSRPALILVLTALLVASGTRAAGNLVDSYTGAVLGRDMAMLRANLPVDLAFALVPLAVAVAWILGAVRLAAGVHAAVVLTFAVLIVSEMILTGAGAFPYPLEFAYVLAMPVVIMLLLLAAWRLRWSPPRPRWLWLLALPACVVGWKGIGAWGRHGVYYSELGGFLGMVVVMIATGILAAWLARRHRWPWIAAAGLAGFLVAYYLTDGGLRLLNYLWFAPHQGDPLPFALVLVVLGVAVRGLGRRFRPAG